MSAPSAEQRAAIDAPGAQVAVAAGAGSGKTTMLVEAIWEDLELHGVRPEELFVATYNRAAAAHLQARVQARFADDASGRGRDRASLDLSAGWVGTFHSLCGRIVREHPFAAGVDPAFAELDETATAAIVEEALDEAIERCDHPGFVDLLVQAWGPRPVRDAARAAHERLRAAGQERPRLQTPPPPPDRAPLIAQLRGRAAAVLERTTLREDHRREAEAGLEMAATGILPARPPRGGLNCTKELKPDLKALNEAAAALYEAIADREARQQLEGFADLLAGFADGYERRKRERGALDYEDLQLAARRVLRAGAPYRFRRVYVDEYQDVNPLQDEILELLGAERTVVVGDGAQSIYGFRHADPARFLARAAAHGALALRDNYRSQPPLLAALNCWLAGALANDPAFAELRPMAAPVPGPALAEPPAELVTVSGDGAVSREQEARVVAEVVAGLLESGYAHRDVAVLFRSLTQVEPYRAALERLGIPCHLVAGGGFFQHDQVADALALLALVENPFDEPALVRALASPYLAASDEELVGLRTAAGEREPLWPALAAVPALDGLAATVAALRGLRREAGLAGLLEAAIAARDYDLAALGMAEGARRFANLRRLVRMAESFAAVRGPDLRGFLALLEAQKDLAQDPGEAVLVDPALDAVRLSTVHGVKGQEFPAVVLADASHGTPGGGGQIVRVDPDGRCGIRMQRVGASGAPSALYRVLEAEAKAAEEAEERRIVYVALTRAQRHVSVVGRTPRAGSAHQILGDALGAMDDGSVLARTVAAAALAPAGSELPQPPVPLEVTAPLPPAPLAVDRLRGRRLSFSALEGHATCPLRFRLEVDLRLPAGPRLALGGASESGPWGAAAVGTLIHERLALQRWGDPAPAPGWAAAAALAAGLPPSAAEGGRAERLVAQVLADSLAQRIAAGRAAAERPFALLVDGTLLTGFMDLVVQEPDGGTLVVDWKSHRLEGVEPGELMGAYRLQQAIYGLAMLRAGAARAELRWTFLDALDAPQVRVVAGADAGALEDEVRAALAAVRDGPPTAAADRPQPFCDGCPGLRAFCPVSRHPATAAAALRGPAGGGLA
jgi:ATP-dependent helicase/nuclease subunit A